MAATNESVVYGLGELHLRTLLDRLTEVHSCQVDTRPPRIAYRETITAPAEGHHRHKKQTGGAGQFGEVFLRVEPLPRGTGFEFVDQVKGGAIPHNFMPAVEKGVRQAHGAGRGRRLSGGGPARSSSTTASTTAWTARRSPSSRPARRRCMAAVQAARPSVLEPIVNVEIAAPEAEHGRHHRRPGLTARPGERHAVGGSQRRLTVLAQAPLSELASYQSRLNSLTGGQGRYTLAFSHYEPVPPAVQAQLASQYKVRDES